MADRTETQPRDGNGSTRQINVLDGHVVTESVHRLEALAPTQSIAALTQQLNQLTQEVAESRHRGEQLGATLEKSKGRLQQLIGERNRLASLLAERDAELQRLNQELGALTERATAAERGSPTLFTAARSLFDRIQQRRKPVRNVKPAASRPQKAASAPNGTRLVPWVKHHPPKDVFAAVVVGLSEAEIERVLKVVEGYGAGHDTAPLLLTDNDAFQLFRGRRVLFEFLPPRADQERLAPELDWRLYTLRRLALIRRKWQPVRVVAFGRRAAEVVQLWRDSPFEETPLPAPLSGRSAGSELPWSPAPPTAIAPR